MVITRNFLAKTVSLYIVYREKHGSNKSSTSSITSNSNTHWRWNNKENVPMKSFLRKNTTWKQSEKEIGYLYQEEVRAVGSCSHLCCCQCVLQCQLLNNIINFEFNTNSMFVCWLLPNSCPIVGHWWGSWFEILIVKSRENQNNMAVLADNVSVPEKITSLPE